MFANALLPPPVLLLFDVSGMEFVIIIFVALMVYGGKLPDVARTLGKTIGEFKRHAARFSEDMQDSMQERSPRKPLRPPGPPSGKPIARGPVEPQLSVTQSPPKANLGAPPAEPAAPPAAKPTPAESASPTSPTSPTSKDEPRPAPPSSA